MGIFSRRDVYRAVFMTAKHPELGRVRLAVHAVRRRADGELSLVAFRVSSADYERQLVRLGQLAHLDNADLIQITPDMIDEASAVQMVESLGVQRGERDNWETAVMITPGNAGGHMLVLTDEP